jgi:hypothetical protein
MHTVDVFCWDGDVIQERLARHAVVAVGVFRRQTALVSPEDMNPLPVQALGILIARQ